MRDRRQAPRRAEEAVLHYAEQSLMQAALKAAEVYEPYREAWPEDHPLRVLVRAADTYKQAEQERREARQ